MSDFQLADLPPNARILCVRLSALGDIVFALPALNALRSALPRAQIDWLVEDRHAAVLLDHPSIHQLRQYPRKNWRSPSGILALGSHLRGLSKQNPYDLVLDFQSNLKSALQLRFIHCPVKVGFAKPIAREGAQRFHHLHAKVPSRCHRSDRDLQLLRRLGWQASPNFAGRWPLAPDFMESWTPLDHPYILLHTTTTVYGQDKQWAQSCWATLAQKLEAAGHKVLLLWTPADRAKVEAVVSLAQGAASLAPATPSLAHLMALTDDAQCLVGTDSGPVHLAAYRGTKVVALFGPTDPMVYRPPGNHVQIVYPGAEGEAPPPRDRSCPSPWMTRIEPSVVATAVLQLEG